MSCSLLLYAPAMTHLSLWFLPIPHEPQVVKTTGTFYVFLAPERAVLGLNAQKPKVVGDFADDTYIVIRIGEVKAWPVDDWDGDLRDEESTRGSSPYVHVSLEQVNVPRSWQLVPD